MSRPAEIVETASRLSAELREGASPERAEKEKAYLKSELTFYGQPMPGIRAVAKRFLRANPALATQSLLSLVEELWREPVYERRALAVKLLEARTESLSVAEIPLLERLLRESKTWALVDALAVSVVGPLCERDESAAAVLERWARDDDFWIRRSALLAHLEALRRGEGDFERFGRYAEAMLDESEVFIRKAIGWVLRDTSRKRPGLVYGWIAPRAHVASGVTVREAVKRLDENDRERVLRAYREKRPIERAG